MHDDLNVTRMALTCAFGPGLIAAVGGAVKVTVAVICGQGYDERTGTAVCAHNFSTQTRDNRDGR